MFLVLKNSAQNWQPTANLVNLRKRAEILSQIRNFFYQRNILEVETPLLCSASIPDPNIHSLQTQCLVAGQAYPKTFYLQTSPEFAMKRLLAAGSGSIFQIGKAFRDAEMGSYHNPEFTMLEWYHLNFDHQQLMNEMDELLQVVLKTKPAERLSYQELFERYIGVNPHTATPAILSDKLQEFSINIDQHALMGGDDYLNLLMTHTIEPELGREKPIFVYDYPASQSALARLRKTASYQVAERFEVYYHGTELANGFHELTDAMEQKKRFEQEQEKRVAQGLSPMPLDAHFLAALEQGLPDCAGVALGVDRLIMLALGVSDIQEVITFPTHLA